MPDRKIVINSSDNKPKGKKSYSHYYETGKINQRNPYPYIPQPN